MLEREYKLPPESVESSIKAFKNSHPEVAESCLKVFKSITQKYPESGLNVPGRPLARRIVDSFEFSGLKIECDLTYTFNEKAVLWALFKWKSI